MRFIPVTVESYSGYIADEYPRFIIYEDVKYEVGEVTDRWYQCNRDPQDSVYDYFKVITTCNRQFLLRHEHESDNWFIVE